MDCVHCPNDDTHMEANVLIVLGSLALGLIECGLCGYRMRFRVVTTGELP